MFICKLFMPLLFYLRRLACRFLKKVQVDFAGSVSAFPRFPEGFWESGEAGLMEINSRIDRNESLFGGSLRGGYVHIIARTDAAF